jgi:hypothetical protein
MGWQHNTTQRDRFAFYQILCWDCFHTKLDHNTTQNNTTVYHNTKNPFSTLEDLTLTTIAKKNLHSALLDRRIETECEQYLNGISTTPDVAIQIQTRQIKKVK